MNYWYGDNPNCGRCGHLNGHGFCNMTACIYPVIYESSTLVVKPKTNADRIRTMTDEGLADELMTAFAAFYNVEWSKEAVLDWLKQEVEE